MANEIVKPHKFEVSKNKIHSLSTSVSNVSLQKFPTEGSIFPLNDHNITGDEANTLLVSPLQSALISQNTSIRSLFNIADEVYNALESLDKEYIQGIISAVKSAEIASDQAKAASTKANTASNQALEASRKALDASTKATTAQADIKRTIEALQTTVRILKEFKEKVTKDLSSIASLNTRITSVNNKIQNVENMISDVADSAKEIKDFQHIFSNLNHIKDVDQIWNDLKSSREVVKGLIDTLTPFMSRVNDADKELHGEINKISTLLESYQHLGDVDAIWSDVEGHKTNLASFHQQVDAFVEKVNQATARIDGDIEALKQYRTLLESYQHLGDVDAIWSDVEGHKTNLASFHQQVDAFVEKVNQATARIDGDIEALKQYRTLLESYQHLGDVDAIWSDVESQKTDLLGLHEKLDAFIEETHLGLERIEGLIHQLEEDNFHAHLQYNKKIKIAFWLGGSAVGFIVINYILQIIGVL